MPGLKKVAICIFVILVVIWSVFPVYWMVNISLMKERDVYAVPPNWIPPKITFEQYASIFGLISEVSPLMSGQPELVQKGLINSFIIGSISSSIAVTIASLAAYIFARYNFRFKSKFLLFLLMTRMLPAISIVVPYYIIFTTYNLVGTHLGLIITYIAALIPINVWFLVGIFASLPIEVERAARVDGCGRLKTFFLIVTRMGASGIISTGLLSFTTCWNEFTFAQLLNAGSPAQTLQSSISGLFTHFVLLAMTGAAVTLSAIPSIVLTLMLGKYIAQIRGLGSMTIREAM